MPTPPPYIPSPLAYTRRPTRTVDIGGLKLGSDYPIRVQSMTIADTQDTAGTVRDVERLVFAGSEIVRITVPTQADADNLPHIRAEMKKRGLQVPIAADIHFTPSVAMKAVEHVEKVRVNPGNFADKKRFKVFEFSDAEYKVELERIYEKFSPLVKKCKEYGRAMRIGTNHGSLSDRIVNRYGDTPEGMVESALEFARICEDLGFQNYLFSMKASSPLVMIAAYRLLVSRIDALNLRAPLHLGVTEAGDGEDGRIKSAVGIGALLEDGIGDTVRVSLTEDPEYEIPVALDLVAKFNRSVIANNRRERGNLCDDTALAPIAPPWNPYTYARRDSQAIAIGSLSLGATEPIRVSTPIALAPRNLEKNRALLKRLANERTDGPALELASVSIRTPGDLEAVADLQIAYATEPIAWKLDVRGSWDLALAAADHADALSAVPTPSRDPAQLAHDLQTLVEKAKAKRISLTWYLRDLAAATHTAPEALLRAILTCGQDAYGSLDQAPFIFSAGHAADLFDTRALAIALAKHGTRAPILLSIAHPLAYGDAPLGYAAQIGALLKDGIGDAIELSTDRSADPVGLQLSYNILQATGLRIFKADFVSCPSCGRTQFDLQTTTTRIKARFGHLKGVKIAVMGCIVNGPGEMADAHFGYVGAGPHKIDLYVGKECIERGIASTLADERLQELIARHGKWVEPNPTPS